MGRAVDESVPQAAMATLSTTRPIFLAMPKSDSYLVPAPSPIAAWAAARRATGTRNGLQET